MILFVGFDLLDRQILDRDGQDVGKVDDVEFGLDEHGVPYLTALLVGPHALGPRLGGWLGRLVSGVAANTDAAERGLRSAGAGQLAPRRQRASSARWGERIIRRCPRRPGHSRRRHVFL